MAIAPSTSGRLIWRTPTIPAENIAYEYVRLVSKLNGVRAVKAAIKDGGLVIYTLISPSRELEEHLHKIELETSDWAVGVPFSFCILEDGQAFAEAAGADAEEIFHD